MLILSGIIGGVVGILVDILLFAHFMKKSWFRNRVRATLDFYEEKYGWNSFAYKYDLDLHEEE